LLAALAVLAILLARPPTKAVTIEVELTSTMENLKIEGLEYRPPSGELLFGVVEPS